MPSIVQQYVLEERAKGDARLLETRRQYEQHHAEVVKQMTTVKQALASEKSQKQNLENELKNFQNVAKQERDSITQAFAQNLKGVNNELDAVKRQLADSNALLGTA